VELKGTPSHTNTASVCLQAGHGVALDPVTSVSSSLSIYSTPHLA
jgi:hypothetical protein